MTSRDEAQALRETVSGWVGRGNRALNGAAGATGLSEKVDQHPYQMLGAALGVGYVLGGGLFTATTARLVRLGFKLAGVPAIQEKLLDVAEIALDGWLASSKKDSR
jgi:hypothetical protein